MFKTVFQVLFGLALCATIAIWLVYSPLPMFWELEDPQPHVYSITWRSGVALILLLAITQGISFLVFRCIRLFSRGRRRVTTSANRNI
jgi:hypothetical protein